MRKVLLTSAAIGAIALSGPAIAAAPHGDAPASDPAEFSVELNTVAAMDHDALVIGQLEDEEDDEFGVGQIEDEDEDDGEEDEYDVSQIEDDEDEDDGEDDEWSE